MTLDKNLSLTAAISAIIFASTVPVEVTKLAAHFEVTAEDIMNAAEKIKKQFEDSNCGIRLKETDGRYSFSLPHTLPYQRGHPNDWAPGW